MKKYFISLEGQQTGPYTIEELQAMNLTNKYLVWTDGFSGWKSIQSIQELRESITKLPPKIENQKLPQISNSILGRIVLFSFLISASLFYYLGGFTEKNELMELYFGGNYLYNTNLNSYESVPQVRVIIAGFSLLQGLLIGLLIYYVIKMNMYKKSYLKAIK